MKKKKIMKMRKRQNKSIETDKKTKCLRFYNMYLLIFK